MSFTFQKSKGCSQCCEGTLEMMEPGKERAVNDSEESFAYYECDRCGFRVRESETGRTEIPSDEEWTQFCE